MGTKDTIQEEDLEDEDTRAELENQLEVERKQRELFEEKFAFMQEQAQKDKTEMEENLLKMRAMIMDKASDELKEKG